MSTEWQIIWSSSAGRQFRKLPSHVQSGVERKVRWLAEHVGEIAHEKLHGEPVYSLHIGQYRVLYELNWAQQRVEIARVGAHNAAYRR